MLRLLVVHWVERDQSVMQAKYVWILVSQHLSSKLYNFIILVAN